MIVNIEEYTPYEVAELICLKCNTRWIGVYPQNTLLYARLNTCSGKYFVECSHENWCETLPKTWLYNTKEEAIEAWNRRTE